MAVRGALIPNQRTTISNIVPKGTAPEDPPKTRKRSKRKTTMNTKLKRKNLRCMHNGYRIGVTYVGRRVAVKKAAFRLSVPPRERYTLLEM